MYVARLSRFENGWKFENAIRSIRINCVLLLHSVFITTSRLKDHALGIRIRVGIIAKFNNNERTNSHFIFFSIYLWFWSSMCFKRNRECRANRGDIDFDKHFVFQITSPEIRNERLPYRYYPFRESTRFRFKKNGHRLDWNGIVVTKNYNLYFPECNYEPRRTQSVTDRLDERL